MANKFNLNDTVIYSDSQGSQYGRVIEIMRDGRYVVSAVDSPYKTTAKYWEEELMSEAEYEAKIAAQTETQSTTETERKSMNEQTFVVGEIVKVKFDDGTPDVYAKVTSVLHANLDGQLYQVWETENEEEYVEGEQGWSSRYYAHELMKIDEPQTQNLNADDVHAASAQPVSDEYSALIENRNVSDNWEQEEIDEQERNTAHASEPQPDSAQAEALALPLAQAVGVEYATADVRNTATGAFFQLCKGERSEVEARVEAWLAKNYPNVVKINQYQWGNPQSRLGEPAYAVLTVSRPQPAATQTPAAHEDAVSDDEYDNANEAAFWMVRDAAEEQWNNNQALGKELVEAHATIAKLKTDLQTALTVLAETRVERDSLRAELITAWKYVDDIAPNKAAEKEAKKQLKKLGVKSTYN